MEGIANTLHLGSGWEVSSPSNSHLLIQQISVSIKEIVRLGRDFPWKRPERCPRCSHCRLWGHGFVSAYFDGYSKPLWLRRYRCPACRLILELKPSGYFKRFQAPIETIRQTLAHRFKHHLWPPGTDRQRPGHWLRSLCKKAKLYLGLQGGEGMMEAFDQLVSLGINPVSRSV